MADRVVVEKAQAEVERLSRKLVLGYGVDLNNAEVGALIERIRRALQRLDRVRRESEKAPRP